MGPRAIGMKNAKLKVQNGKSKSKRCEMPMWFACARFNFDFCIVILILRLSGQVFAF
jgi:hypothetical protein